MAIPLPCRRVLGWQCHLEATPASVRALASHCREELEATGPYVQSHERLLAGTDYVRLHRVLAAMLDRLFGGIKAVS